jgi:hypothetical protein
MSACAKETAQLNTAFAPGARTNGMVMNPDDVAMTRPVNSDAACPGELPGLEAFFAEDRTSLRRPERYRCLLPAG